MASPATRGLSRFQDFVLPPLLALPFLTGLLVMHPAWNPFPFDAMRLLHVISADLVLVLVPITKLSHIALLPLAQLATEAAWRFPPHAGSAVGEALGRGSEPV